MKIERLGVMDEVRRIVRMPDGTLRSYFLLDAGGVSGTDPVPGVSVARMMSARSDDHGATWSEPRQLFTLSTQRGFWYGWDAMVDRDGGVHLFTLHDRGTGVGGVVIGEGDKDCRKLYGTCLDLWHVRSADGETWNVADPDYGDRLPDWKSGARPGPAHGLACIWKGYTGSLNSVIQLRGGRIVLAFSYMNGRHWFNRYPGLDNFSFHGLFACTVIYTDDGVNWKLGTQDLKVWVPEPTNTYGACEPVLVERKDGRVWMVIRAQTGRLYESVSDDGAVWSVPRAYDVWSSDSPVGLSRLPDGRLVMIWNCCLRYPYAYGGRQVIHAAISEDEGRTWIGVRECARDPKRLEPPPDKGGDFGTAYPYPAVTSDGRVIFSTGQGAGRVQMVRMDPAWLYERAAETRFDDADEWQTFGTRGVERVPHDTLPGRFLLRVCKPVPGPTSAAVWNFPSGLRGEVAIRLRAERGAGALRVSLSDHFSTPFDPEDQLWSLFNHLLEARDDRWHTLTLRWDAADARACVAHWDGIGLGVSPLRHATRGACYLRVVPSPGPMGEASDVDERGWWIESARVELR